jgi:hypothetical protein
MKHLELDEIFDAIREGIEEHGFQLEPQAQQMVREEVLQALEKEKKKRKLEPILVTEVEPATSPEEKSKDKQRLAQWSLALFREGMREAEERNAYLITSKDIQRGWEKNLASTSKVIGYAPGLPAGMGLSRGCLPGLPPHMCMSSSYSLNQDRYLSDPVFKSILAKIGK